MFFKFFITFLFFLPLQIVFAAQAETTSTQEANNSVEYYNLALKEFNSGKLGPAKASIEQSLFLNPISSSSRTLNSKITDVLTKSLGERLRESVPSYIRLLDVIPYFFSYIFLILALILLSFRLGKLHFNEKSIFKANPRLRIKVAGLVFLLLCSILFHIFKAQSHTTQWVCVSTSNASLFTGPNSKNFVKTASLPEGSCVRVVSSLKNWMSIKPTHYPAGWVNHNDVTIVRGYKFDPLQNKD